GEEQGLYGSTFFVNQLNSLQTTQTLAMLDEEGPATGVASAELQPLLEALLEAIGPLEGRTRRKER
ncbi:MAG: hypothetical protein J7485_04410, partial [Sphingobium sp.]|nr:hypothetical protein [Sphingobium sp.]